VLAAYEVCISRNLFAQGTVDETTNQDKPIASIDDAISHVAMFVASEIQYAT
jgi:hypothetical protein